MIIEIKAVGQNAVVIVSYEDGETPHAYTIAEIRDWITDAMTVDEVMNDRFGKGSIVDKVLEKLELDLINPVPVK